MIDLGHQFAADYFEMESLNMKTCVSVYSINVSHSL